MTYEQMSNGLVYASMAAFALAFLAFAVSMAATRGREAEELALVGVVRASGRRAAVATLDVPPRESDRSVPGQRAANIGMSVTWLATILLAAGVLVRGVAAGRPPWGNMYEFSIASACAISAAFLVLSLRRDMRWLGLFVVLPVLLTLGLAVTVLYTDAEGLVPALRSYWLSIHVTLAIVCGGALCVGAALSASYLVADTARSRAADDRPYWLGSLAQRLPEPVRLDALAYRVNAFVFPLWTFTIVAGAIWAESAWGRYWGWDPKETWAFITWVAYAAYLHARATAGWKGRKAAWLGLIAFGCFVFNYYGVNLFFNGLHSYSGVR